MKVSAHKVKLHPGMEIRPAILPDPAGFHAETARVFAAERLRTEQNKLRTQLGYMKKMLDGDAIPKYQVGFRSWLKSQINRLHL